MRNPFRRRTQRRATARAGATTRPAALHRDVPRGFLEMTRAEQLEWCGQLLEGLVPLRRDDPDDD